MRLDEVEEIFRRTAAGLLRSALTAALQASMAW